MSDEIINDDEQLQDESAELENELTDNEEVAEDDELTEDTHSDYKPTNRFDASAVHHLSGMYQNWFLDYASYVILERAVPHIEDGLKPVQRRILHSMKRMDDGRYNKVANIVGHTMQFHPHGDASIGDALVQMGQKELLVDTQGNWGNILTGDRAAAPRYIEARLSKFALDVVFNPKTTDWQLSYDGRNKEPITLPAKFPLLLAQGAAGLLLAFMLLFSQHPAVGSNWQIWVLNPLALVGIPFVIKAAIRHRPTLWFALYFAVLALFLLFSPWIPQEFAKITVPLALCMLTRPLSYHIAGNRKPVKKQPHKKSSR
jgi:hypothetical protein